jgi:hypothetical protein
MLPINEEDYYAELEELNGTVIYGDARRCPHHPGIKTSSDDGMFDGVCYICEGEAFDAAEMWKYDPANPRRSHCGIDQVYVTNYPHFFATCLDTVEEDNIPF